MPNPENIIPPQKGEVRNPAGKPKGTRNRSTIVREMLEIMRGLPDHLKTSFPEFDGKISYEQVVTLAQLSKAEFGDTNAYKAVMDSAYGAPKQAIEHTGEDGAPIQVDDLSKLSTNELRERIAALRTGTTDPPASE